MKDDLSKKLTNESEVFDAYPFLLSFPFNEYVMSMEKDDDFATSSGIDPVVISEAGKYVKFEFINFNHQSKYTKITLSFYTYDIMYVSENTEKIKKLDSVRENLDMGLTSNNILEKITCIKSGEAFLKKIGSSLPVGKALDGMFDKLLISGGFELSKSETRKIKSMFKTIKEDDYEHGIQSVIKSFYNIHLHHIKILLGVVIACKIH